MPIRFLHFLFLGIILVVLCAPSAAQYAEQTVYPSKQEVMASLRNADYAIRRFEEVSAQVNFGRWKAPFEVVDVTRQNVEAGREWAIRAKALIARLTESGRASGFDLFRVYDGLAGIDFTLANLGDKTERYARDSNVAAELTNTATTVTKTRNAFLTVLAQQLQAEEWELLASQTAKK
jgi:hypothetical protein